MTLKSTPAVLLIGTGPMAVAYARVLTALGAGFVVVGRGEESRRAFAAETGITPAGGGVAAWVKNHAMPAKAIVAVGVPELAGATQELLSAGCAEVLLEKPGGVTEAEIRAIQSTSLTMNATVLVAYNRRFFESVSVARQMAAQDGGVTSVAFEFTEKATHIEGLPLARSVKAGNFLFNSSHVVDLAFFLAGWPVEMCSFVEGQLSWHPAGAVYAGAGRTDAGALFSYQANWTSAGRWGVEIMTPERRIILRPLESVQCQRRGSFAIESVPIDDRFDKEFKPGLYRQVEAFLGSELSLFPSINAQVAHLDVYRRMNPAWEGLDPAPPAIGGV